MRLVPRISKYSLIDLAFCFSLSLLSMLFKSKFTKGLYEPERKVVQEEILQINDDLDRLINDKIHELIFSKETDKVKDRISSREDGNILRVGNPIAGYYDNIMSIEVDKAKEFYDKFYRPSNMVVSITSDKNLKKIKQLVRQYFVEELES